ncbi:MAG: ROK family protein [Bacteroidota bacterium]
MKKDVVLGVDVGGSGIKGALVNVKTGEMLTERFRLETPQPSYPNVVADTFKTLVDHFKWKGLIGCGFPSTIKKGVAQMAANIHKDWIGTNVEKLFAKKTGCDVYVLNDADAAGMAEFSFGNLKSREGTIILITIGTGLGSAIFVDGHLLPNSEFGHFYLKGQNGPAEHYAANSARKREKLSWEEWGARFNEYLMHLEFLLSPDLFILGGGACKKLNKFEDQLKVKANVIAASLENNAGIVGAATYAYKRQSQR